MVSGVCYHSGQAELQKSLQEDDIDDGLKQLSGFKLLVKSITGIDCTRQDSLTLVQEARNALVKSNYLSVCQDNRHRAMYHRVASHLFTDSLAGMLYR